MRHSSKFFPCFLQYRQRNDALDNFGFLGQQNMATTQSNPAPLAIFSKHNPIAVPYIFGHEIYGTADLFFHDFVICHILKLVQFGGLLHILSYVLYKSFRLHPIPKTHH